MKVVLKIILIVLIWFSTFYMNYSSLFASTVTSDQYNLKTWNINTANNKSNSFLSDLFDSTTDFKISTWWEKWIFNTLLLIARDLKNLFYVIASIYFLIIVIRLIFSSKTEEEVSNFKKWIIWISVWIIVMQIAYYFAKALYDMNINKTLATNFAQNIIEPLIKLLETAASFFFLAIMIYAFYRIITANWDDEKVKRWKMSVFYAAIWFLVIKLSTALVTSIYGTVKRKNSLISADYELDTNIQWFSGIIVDVINWMNSFLWLLIVIMIIYAGFLALTSIWDEEKFKKAKNIILYITIWVAILITNYLILTFFIYPEY